VEIYNKVSNKKSYTQYWIGVTACIVLGLILVAAGMGKLFVNLPNETEFFEQLAPIFSITESESKLIAYALPWVEIVAGLLLLLQIWPSIVAIIICVPLCIGFATNNIWMIMSGVEYESCNLCFGQLEILLGSLTPIQALIFDAVLLALVLIIVFVNHKYKLLYGLFDK
jgi:uncharacterized membrane protein YphA (DoxX/SURF4 family)